MRREEKREEDSFLIWKEKCSVLKLSISRRQFPLVSSCHSMEGFYIWLMQIHDDRDDSPPFFRDLAAKNGDCKPVDRSSIIWSQYDSFFYSNREITSLYSADHTYLHREKNNNNARFLSEPFNNGFFTANYQLRSDSFLFFSSSDHVRRQSWYGRSRSK